MVAYQSPPRFSWVGRTGDGCRYDHAFCSRELAGLVTSCQYVHRPRSDKLSDHSALTLHLPRKALHDRRLSQSMLEYPARAFTHNAELRLTSGIGHGVDYMGCITKTGERDPLSAISSQPSAKPGIAPSGHSMGCMVQLTADG